MAVPKITPADVSVTLDGKVRIEGEQARILTNLMVQRHQAALDVFRKVAPTIKANQVRVDSFGRIEIDHPKITKVALTVATTSDRSKLGAAVAEPLADDPNDVAPPDFDTGCADHDGPNYLDVFCLGDGGLNIVCGGTNLGDGDGDDDDCDVDLFCGSSG